MMKDGRPVEHNRRMMQMVSELEVDLKGGDAVNATMRLEDLEIAVYGSFAKMLEARLRYLKAAVTEWQPLPEWQPPPLTYFEEKLMNDGPG